MWSWGFTGLTVVPFFNYCENSDSGRIIILGFTSGTDPVSHIIHFLD